MDWDACSAWHNVKYNHGYDPVSWMHRTPETTFLADRVRSVITVTIDFQCARVWARPLVLDATTIPLLHSGWRHCELCCYNIGPFAFQYFTHRTFRSPTRWRPFNLDLIRLIMFIHFTYWQRCNELTILTRVGHPSHPLPHHRTPMGRVWANGHPKKKKCPQHVMRVLLTQLNIIHQI